VWAAIATLPDRVPLLERAVASLLDQVGRVCVYLNGHKDVPGFLKDDRIVVERGDNSLGDAAKFWWAAGAPGYYLTVDDDLEFAHDYVARMVEAIERYQRQAAVGVLGRVMERDFTSYYKGAATRYRVRDELEQDERVHVLGTGTVGFYAPAMGLTMSEFPAPNMGDVWFALAARRRAMPLIAIARPRNWIKINTPPRGTTIYERYRRTGQDALQTKVMREAGPWLPLPPLTRDGLLSELSRARRSDGVRGA
jgi:hypothetical protein